MSDLDKKVYVPVFGNMLKKTSVNPKATKGAVLGVNLFDANGNVYQVADIVNPKTTPTDSSGETTDDIEEGEFNFYFTADRFYAALKAGLDAGDNITITFDDSAKTATIASTGAPFQLNYAVNGWFQHWQRGTSFTGTALTADAWQTYLAGATCTTSRVSVAPGTFQGDPHFVSRHVVVAGVADEDLCVEIQQIEDVRTLAGKSCYLSLQVEVASALNMAVNLIQYYGDGAGYRSDIGNTLVALIAGVNQIHIPIAIPEIDPTTPFGTAKTDFLGIHLWLDAGTFWAGRTGGLGHQSGTFDIGTVSLSEAKSTFSRPDPAAELSRCQRYFEKSFDQNVAPAQNAGTDGVVFAAQAVGASAASVVAGVSFKQTKRITTPTITLYNPKAANAQVRNDTVAADWTSSTVVYLGDGGFGVAGTSPAGSAAGNRAIFHWSAEASIFRGTSFDAIVRETGDASVRITSDGSIRSARL